MAGIEKVDELTGEYCSWMMYGYKYNSIQISPKSRKQFKNKKAVLFIFKPHQLVRKYKYGGISHVDINSDYDNGYIKFNGKWCEWVQDWTRPRYEVTQEVHLTPEYDYCLYVPELQGEVSGKYWNHSYNISTVKRKLNRMLGYKVPIIKLDITSREFYKLSKQEREEIIKL